MGRTVFMGQDAQANAVELGVSELSRGLTDSLPSIVGNIYHVCPYTGSDTLNNGLSPASPFKTLVKALAVCTANQNDTVILHSQGNAKALTTVEQAATLDWNKDLVHLFGVNSGVSISPRSRIAFTDAYAVASNLFTVSASGCLFRNLLFVVEVASVLPTGCVKITGARNRFEQCHFAGFVATTNDIAGAYALKLDGAEENEFDHCVIGTFTLARGSQLNSEILFDTAAKENLFENCRVVSQVSHATNHVLVEVADATGIDAFNYFRNTLFLYQSANYAVAATGVFRLPALTQGYFAVDALCMAISDAPATLIKWDVNSRDKIAIVGPVKPAGDTSNVGLLV